MLLLDKQEKNISHNEMKQKPVIHRKNQLRPEIIKL